MKDFFEAASAEHPDWEREQPQSYWYPSRRLLRSIRRYQAARGIFSTLRKKYWVAQHRFWSIVTSSDIPIDSEISGGLLLPHPAGVVIHNASKIGPNCHIFQQVTITSDVEIGGHVDIGAGAKIIGPVVIGNHVRVGANAVVTRDIPSNVTVAGIPARILTQKS